MHINLSGKRVLVTGGNSGLGAAIAAAFASENAHVAINYVANRDKAEEMAESFATKGAKAIAIRADISDRNAVSAMFGTLDDMWGGIDILVNNAGIDGHAALGWEVDQDHWSEVIDINLKGSFLCAREALKRMVPQKSGVVISTTSVHEVIPWTGYSAYAASKAGLSMMSKTLAQEAAPHNVRVLCIAPGAIKTPINRSVWQDNEGYRDLIAKIPMGRIGQPEDIAKMAVVLASDVASYLTGTTVFIDGGMSDYPGFMHGG